MTTHPLRLAVGCPHENFQVVKPLRYDFRLFLLSNFKNLFIDCSVRVFDCSIRVFESEQFLIF